MNPFFFLALSQAELLLQKVWNHVSKTPADAISTFALILAIWSLSESRKVRKATEEANRISTGQLDEMRRSNNLQEDGKKPSMLLSFGLACKADTYNPRTGFRVVLANNGTAAFQVVRVESKVGDGEFDVPRGGQSLITYKPLQPAQTTDGSIEILLPEEPNPKIVIRLKLTDGKTRSFAIHYKELETGQLVEAEPEPN